jgi:hypothetical protein
VAAACLLVVAGCAKDADTRAPKTGTAETVGGAEAETLDKDKVLGFVHPSGVVEISISVDPDTGLKGPGRFVWLQRLTP